MYYSGGNLGIGTGSPGSKLTVAGTIESTSGGFKFPDATTQTTAALAGTNYWTLSATSLYPTSTTYAIGVGTATLDANYKITTSGGGIKAESTSTPAGYFNSVSGYGLIVNTGNVGIGTTSPAERLEVYQGNIKATQYVDTYTSQYPPAQNSTYVKASNGGGEPPYQATDPTKSLTGDSTGNQWLSGYYQITDARFHIDLGSAKIITRIYYENNHNSGAQTDRAVNNFTFWGSNGASSFTELTYAIDTGWTRLTTSQSNFDQHVAADQADPKYITVTNTTAYRYYALKFADAFSGGVFMGVRRIELQTGSFGGNIYVDGKVGIGTVSPAQKLDVVGSINSTNVLVNGASVGTSGVGVIAIAVGTIPSSSPSDETQLYSEAGTGYVSAYPPAYTSTYVKATYGGAGPWNATDPGTTLTGDKYAANSGLWQSGYWDITDHRFHIDLGSAKVVKRIYYQNSHTYGGTTANGVKNFTFWGSNSVTAFTNITYAGDTNWTQITPAQSTFDQHTASDVLDPKYITVTNTTAYRYYAFKFADTWGGNYMEVRRIELQTALVELKVRDGAGNVTTLSPHNFENMPNDVVEKVKKDSNDMAWTYHSEANGKEITVDMFNAIKDLEAITGKKYIYTDTKPQ